MSVEFIEYKGKKILYANYDGLKTVEKVMENLQLLESALAKCAVKQLVLGNFNDTFVSPQFIQKMTHLAKNYFPIKVSRSAVFGVKGIKRVLYEGYLKVTGDPMKAFDTELDAKEYLVADNAQVK